MNELDHELEKLWQSVKEEQWRSDEFTSRMRVTTTLNSVAILFLCISLLIMFYVVQKELPILSRKENS